MHRDASLIELSRDNRMYQWRTIETVALRRRAVSLVRRGTVFSHAAFRYMDVVIGAIVAAALLWFALSALLALAER